MQISHRISRRTIDFCSATNHKGSLGEEAATAPKGAIKGRAVKQQETATMMFSLMRFWRARQTYWSVVQELSDYSDRELHDIGIDRADIYEIARLASREQA
jgi:uncharacterized protein YjiS (DUF1127 family)